MNPKTANLLWGLSLILIGISALVLAAGKLGGLVAYAAFQAYFRKQSQRFLACLPVCFSGNKSRNHDILQGSEFREQMMKLEYKANPPVAKVGQRRTAHGTPLASEYSLSVQHQCSGIGRGKRA